jgi:hypothetical protein
MDSRFLLLCGCGILVNHAVLPATAGRGSPASSDVVAGLVQATSIVLALCLQMRGRRVKPGDDAVRV